MKNLAFVIWMVGFGFATSYGDYVCYGILNLNRENMWLASAVEVLIWIYVGTLLYETKAQPVSSYTINFNPANGGEVAHEQQTN